MYQVNPKQNNKRCLISKFRHLQLIILLLVIFAIANLTEWRGAVSIHPTLNIPVFISTDIDKTR